MPLLPLPPLLSVIAVFLLSLPLSLSLPSLDSPIYPLGLSPRHASPQAQIVGAPFLLPPSPGSLPSRPDPRMPAPDPKTWFNASTPPQTSANCHGSAICSRVGAACHHAAARFEKKKLYATRTAYTAVIGAKVKLHRCTAIFECEEGKYGAGMPGSLIQGAYVHPLGLTLLGFSVLTVDSFYDLFETKECNGCGSSYMANGCHVTANYCGACHDSNTGEAKDIDGGAVEQPVQTVSNIANTVEGSQTQTASVVGNMVASPMAKVEAKPAGGWRGTEKAKNGTKHR